MRIKPTNLTPETTILNTNKLKPEPPTLQTAVEPQRPSETSSDDTVHQLEPHVVLPREQGKK